MYFEGRSAGLGAKGGIRFVQYYVTRDTHSGASSLGEYVGFVAKTVRDSAAKPY
jgi:hypothetical protein